MTRSKAQKRIEVLSEQIRRHEHLYYVLDRPELSDEGFDELFRELKELEDRSPDLLMPDSPTQRVAGGTREGLPTVPHEAPMLSLDSDQKAEKVRRFDERVRKAIEGEVGYVLEPKLDGASLELVYEDGVLARAATRGNGLVGERITENARTISSVPLRLRDDDRPTPKLLAVRGEVIIWVDAFERLNERFLAEGRQPFANPRNAAAGALRQLDSEMTARRPLDIFVYDILAIEGELPATQWDGLQALREWGFKVNDMSRAVSSVEEILDYHADLVERRDDIGYEIDGVVIKLNDLKAREELGTTSHHPRWAFAFKFEPRREITRVLKIIASVGRTGVVTPVALMRPVELGGVTVSRATLHNREEVARKDIREGDRIRVQRAGDVIPQVVERIDEPKRKRARVFSMPEACPSCATPLITRGPFSVCPNGFDCPAQLAGRIFHFGSRNALDIEGLGDETAKVLISEGLVRHLPDLFELDSERLAELPGFAEKSASGLVDAIANASPAELHRFLYALGVPEVGVTVARDLANHFGSLEAIREADEETLQEVPGVGPRMSEQIAGFFADVGNSEIVDALLARLEVKRGEPAAKNDALAGQRFVFTGGLSEIARPKAKAIVESLGGKVTGSVSGATSYVVAGDDPGSKLDKARQLEVSVLDEQAFLDLIRQHGAKI